jgi:predicted RNA-binding protein YlxR (DUF448 family)
MALRHPKHIPIRSCVVCRETSDKRQLLRVVRQPEKAGGAVIADATGKMSGRGAYVCANDKCIALAQKQKRFERALAVSSEKIEADLYDMLSGMASRSSVLDLAGGIETNAAAEMLVES